MAAPFSRLPEADAEINEGLAEDVDADGDGVLSEDELRAALKGEDGKKAACCNRLYLEENSIGTLAVTRYVECETEYDFMHFSEKADRENHDTCAIVWA